MKTYIQSAMAVALLGVSNISLAAEQWLHEKLVVNVYGAGVWSQRAVNSRGDVAYNVLPTSNIYFLDVYKNRENITEWLGPWRTAYYFGINDAGQVGYGGWVGGWKNLKVFVDRTDWSTAMLDPNKSYDLGGSQVTSRGEPVWNAKENVAGASADLYVGHRRITQGIPGYYEAGGKVNANYDLAWYLYGDVTGRQYQIFFNDRNITVPVVGYGARVSHLFHVNDGGDVFWTHEWLDSIGRPGSHIYLNDRNITRPLFGDEPWTGASASALNNRGDIAWSAADIRLYPGYDGERFGSKDVFLNEQNISYQFYGEEPHDAYVTGLNDRGDLLWVGGIRATGQGTIWKNQTDISWVAGPDASVDFTPGRMKLDQHGRVAWMDTNRYGEWGWRVWVDDLCLSTDALGPDWRDFGAELLDMGPNGHVLWMSYDRNVAGRVTVWRSTPIPEPSGTAAMCVGLGLLWLRRR
ncbi:MAG: hypothetical protein AMXMBFR61_15060 [Fimbriimonadales bacterium]